MDERPCVLCRTQPAEEDSPFCAKHRAMREEGAKRKRELIDRLNREGK